MSGPVIVQATIAIDVKTFYDLTTSVSDTSGYAPPAPVTQLHDCAANVCQAATAFGLGDENPEDISGDCQIGLDDIALLALDWAWEYIIEVPTVIP